MGKFNGYKCDKCGEEYRFRNETSQPLGYPVRPVFIEMVAWVDATSDPLKVGSYHTKVNMGRSAVWCETCAMKERLILPIKRDEREKEPDPPTPSEMLLNAFRELGFVTREELNDNLPS